LWIVLQLTWLCRYFYYILTYIPLDKCPEWYSRIIWYF
jgi:hypothetical protein